MTGLIQAEIKIEGRVQGVGYRYFAHQRALEFNLKGYTKNQRDGSVLVVAEGNKTDIETFIDWLKQGPPLARVDHIAISWFDKCVGFSEFRIKA